MRPEFTEPEFIENSDPETIQERMMEALPADISNMPGDFPFDFTMPTAIEISQFVQFNLARALMIAFPEYAWGDWLDLHGAQAHVTRHGENRASGHVTVSGEPGTVLEAGTVFCVPATDTQEAIEFSTTERVELTQELAVIPITAVESGIRSNVTAGTITIMSKPVKGVLSIVNEEEVTGGTEQEDDESYYERIHSEHEGSESYVGNDSDYIRWAKEVDGIGDCVVDPAWDGPGTVKLILVDSNGRPANKQLRDAVYEHIVSPSDRSKRLLPTGDAFLTVAAAKTRSMAYACTGVALSGITLNEAESAFQEAVISLYTKAKTEGVLKYNDVRPLLSQINGIEDFDDFTINSGHANVPIGTDEYADTESVVFTEKEG